MHLNGAVASQQQQLEAGDEPRASAANSLDDECTRFKVRHSVPKLTCQHLT
ncbi:uncharacterized protein PHALS_10300 [Plasmopara halstedii]|uniref:Uncharacterized protein n=1 Tax=Plasmopara halstedii TaxID=4781 RepID=A0A0P1AHW4_PLAHL|nr:uncharacterized protein PHALS_10300 [Plasmopara halstedii]CEG40079.1 hypothetical protein PHALS_10300 [Plasmopara halstedii]|eukprot:XP_024576448.1 hypothetical protein PHALS_10300 [Plasmopara halstedii]